MKHEIKELIANADQLKSIAEIILQEAARKGATQAEVGIAANKGFSVSAHAGSVETVEYHQDKAIDITVYFGLRSGSASISDLRKEAIVAAVDAACHIAKFTDEDPAAGLAEKSELAFNYPKLETCFPWHLSVDQAIALACQCEQIALDLDKRIMSAEEVGVSTVQAMSVYANSFGFVGIYPTSHHEMSCVLVAKDNEEMQRDYSYTLSVDPSNLIDIQDLAQQAVTNTVNRLGSRRLATRKAPVIFVAEEARGLIGHFASAISGGSIYRRSSFLLDHIGKRVFPEFVFIQEHPHLAKALGTEPFDNDGVATRSNIFIKDGVLQTYALGVYAARKLGLTTTANSGGTHNLTISHGHKNLPELIKTMHQGLVITELMGHGVNIINGDYSRGAAGFWVENGEIQYPVHEITIAGNLKHMFGNLIEVGNDVDTRGNVRTGSVLLEEMTIAGV